MINFIFEHQEAILNYSRIFVEVTILVVLFKYRYRSRTSDLFLDKKTQDKLIREFKPESLMPNLVIINTLTKSLYYKPKANGKNSGDNESGNAKQAYGSSNQEKKIGKADHYKSEMLEVADYDVFDLRFSNKKEIEETIKVYGIGTCGPPGFYGTLDIHLELERKLAAMLGTDAAILYSNSYTCVNSVITCFCKQHDIVFYHEDNNEAIVRALKITKGTSISFSSMEDLEASIKRYYDKSKRNFIVAEALFRNTGGIVDLPKLLDIKKKYKLRLILDESLSIPLLGKRGISDYYKTNIEDIDMVIGSLAHVFTGNGGFSAGNMHTVDYQRLCAQSYCFSASMPGYLARNAMCNIEKSFDLTKIRKMIQFFIMNFKSERYQIASHIDSPLVLISKKDYNITQKEECLEDIYRFKQVLEDMQIRVGICINPVPALRIVIKEKLEMPTLEFLVNSTNEVINKNY